MGLEDFYLEQVGMLNDALKEVYGDQWVYEHVPTDPEKPFGRKRYPVKVYVRGLFQKQPVSVYYFRIGKTNTPLFEIKASEAVVKVIIRAREKYRRKTKDL